MEVLAARVSVCKFLGKSDTAVMMAPELVNSKPAEEICQLKITFGISADNYRVFAENCSN
jgi:hypothetical protein